MAEVLNADSKTLVPAQALEGVLTRRVLAFLIDYALLAGATVALVLVVGLLGVLTLGLGWLLYFVLGPIILLMIGVYVWNTLGGARQATLGMQMMGIHIVRLDGQRIDGMTAIVHTVLFWAANALLTPLILLATLFTNYRQTVHDLLLATVVIRD